MRSSLAVGLVLIGVAGLAFFSGRQSHHATMAASAAASKIGWEHDLDAALKRANTEKKLVMVDFYTDWCRWCQRLDQTTLTDGAVQKAMAHVVPVRLNAEREGAQEASRFRVDAYPTVIFLSATGAEVGRIPGYLEAGPFLEEIEDIFKRA
ncbi:MAG: thioredoxin family protein [Thermoanaerobaculales bacterium]